MRYLLLQRIRTRSHRRARRFSSSDCSADQQQQCMPVNYSLLYNSDEAHNQCQFKKKLLTPIFLFLNGEIDTPMLMEMVSGQQNVMCHQQCCHLESAIYATIYLVTLAGVFFYPTESGQWW